MTLTKLPACSAFGIYLICWVRGTVLFLSTKSEVSEGYVCSNMLPQVLPKRMSSRKAVNAVYLHLCVPRCINWILLRLHVLKCFKCLSPAAVSLTPSSVQDSSMHFFRSIAWGRIWPCLSLHFVQINFQWCVRGKKYSYLSSTTYDFLWESVLHSNGFLTAAQQLSFLATLHSVILFWSYASDPMPLNFSPGSPYLLQWYPEPQAKWLFMYTAYFVCS